jgi:GxxExxY protein
MHDDNTLTRRIIGCAIDVHRTLGPGLLEVVYKAALRRELTQAGIPHETEQAFPIVYKGEPLDCTLRADLVIDNTVIVEVKSVQQLNAIHEAQLLTYLRVSGIPLGLLMNFNESTLTQGIRRRRL